MVLFEEVRREPYIASILNYFKMEMSEDSISNSPKEKNDCFLSLQKIKKFSAAFLVEIAFMCESILEPGL